MKINFVQALQYVLRDFIRSLLLLWALRRYEGICMLGVHFNMEYFNENLRLE